MTTASIEKVKYKASIRIALLLYSGYLMIFFSTWYMNGIEYTNIGKNAETTKLWYALPTLFGCVFLAIALTFLGWWRIVFFDTSKATPKWLWILPITIMLIILNTLMQINSNRLTPDLVLWASLGAIGVGFGEECITRGSLLVGLRSQYTERKVWLYSTLLFSALHIPNVFFGLPLSGMLFQLLFTFIMGSGLYVVRRVSGNLILPMLLHGLWDSSLFLSQATGASSSLWHLSVYPISILCLIFVFRNRQNEQGISQ